MRRGLQIIRNSRKTGQNQSTVSFPRSRQVRTMSVTEALSWRGPLPPNSSPAPSRRLTLSPMSRPSLTGGNAERPVKHPPTLSLADNHQKRKHTQKTSLKAHREKAALDCVQAMPWAGFSGAVRARAMHRLKDASNHLGRQPQRFRGRPLLANC